MKKSLLSIFPILSISILPISVISCGSVSNDEQNPSNPNPDNPQNPSNPDSSEIDLNTEVISKIIYHTEPSSFDKLEVTLKGKNLPNNINQYSITLKNNTKTQEKATWIIKSHKNDEVIIEANYKDVLSDSFDVSIKGTTKTTSFTAPKPSIELGNTDLDANGINLLIFGQNLSSDLDAYLLDILKTSDNTLIEKVDFAKLGVKLEFTDNLNNKNVQQVKFIIPKFKDQNSSSNNLSPISEYYGQKIGLQFLNDRTVGKNINVVRYSAPKGVYSTFSNFLKESLKEGEDQNSLSDPSPSYLYPQYNPFSWRDLTIEFRSKNWYSKYFSIGLKNYNNNNNIDENFDFLSWFIMDKTGFSSSKNTSLTWSLEESSSSQFTLDANGIGLKNTTEIPSDETALNLNLKCTLKDLQTNQEVSFIITFIFKRGSKPQIFESWSFFPVGNMTYLHMKGLRLPYDINKWTITKKNSSKTTNQQFEWTIDENFSDTKQGTYIGFRIETEKINDGEIFIFKLKDFDNLQAEVTINKSRNNKDYILEYRRFDIKKNKSL